MAMHTPEDSVLQRRRGFSVVEGALGPSRTTRPTRPSRTAPALGAQRVRVAAITDCCWQCRAKVRGIVGVLVEPGQSPDGTGFVPFDDVAEQLAASLDFRTLAARRIGELRHRDSPGVEGGYLSNGCIDCDALIGRFQLEDLVHEHLQGGGTYSQLDLGLAIDLPAAVPARLTALG
jgi:hypothetical protein